jgi:hypothetical protein
MKRAILPVTFSLALALTTVSQGASKVNAVNKNRSGTAAKGYDPVAYFTESKPAKGSPRFSHQWMGATWHFANSNHRDLFSADPQKYAPQFGGYCAWAVSQGYTADIDPEAWKIVGGKLYLNYSKSVQKMWEQDVPKHIAVAEKNWPNLHK